jgi:glucosyl-3-phosphoglycerate synthase
MISVIIPALNESRTIGDVVDFVRRDERVSEVIVVDDGSVDDTAELARAAGAVVVTSTMLGKGASMADGLWHARHEIVLYLDGDMSGLHPDLIRRMTGPLLAGEADFVKARFSRSGGRVTTLTARPLLRVFFPELAHIEQPLGGIIASRRSLLRNLQFETDYGVDIGLLLDAAAHGARIVEVDVGHIAHDSHSLDVLGDMAMQVVRTIFDRAARGHRFSIKHVREVQEVERCMQAEMAVALERLGQIQRLALIVLEGVVVPGSFAELLALCTNRMHELAAAREEAAGMPLEDRLRRVGAVFAGVPQQEVEQVARTMPLSPGAAEAVVALRKAGYRVGLLGECLHLAAEVVRRRVFADFSIAPVMRFRHGKATGKLSPPATLRHPQGCRTHEQCLRNVLLHMIDRMGVSPEQVLAVAATENACCLLQTAGTSVAFRPLHESVANAAGHVIHDSLTELVPLAEASCALGVVRGNTPQPAG